MPQVYISFMRPAGTITKAGANRRAPSVAHGMLGSELVSKMLVAIIRGELQGGQWLVEEDVAAKFGVSRTPVRQAINQLAAFGVVLIYPNRGAELQTFGPDQLRDVYLVRQVLETAATRAACGRIARAALESIRLSTESLLAKPERGRKWAARQMDVDRQLHDLISRSCGSPRLRSELQRYWTLIDAVRMSLGHRHEARVRALSEHLQVIGLLQKGKAEPAADAMAEHIKQTAEAAVALMFETRGSATV